VSCTGCGGHIERLLVEQLGELLLVELGVHLAAAQRHLRDRSDAHPGEMRTQRSGEITPRRAACARSKRESASEQIVTCRAISAPVAVIPMKIGPVQLRIAPLVFSPSAVCARRR